MKSVVIIPCGGGYDSTALALLRHVAQCKASHAPSDTILVHIDYGQKAAEAERASVTKLAERLNFKMHTAQLPITYSSARIMKGTDVGIKPESNRLDLRNPLLITYCASYAASLGYTDIKIGMGFHVEPEGSTFKDAMVEYLQPLAKSLTLASDATIDIVAPIKHLRRDSIFRLGCKADVEAMRDAHSCYQETRCGVCPHCVQDNVFWNDLTPVGEDIIDALYMEVLRAVNVAFMPNTVL